ncbi:MAG: GUN4 domain-containing protein [Hormoscilla sp. GUM202]|nr:GUN4 domain-containing protein [Hormoscilla sp. GUM202]
MKNEEAIMPKQNVMHLSSEVESNATQIGMKELLQEIQATPKEHWSNLLQMVRLFRKSVTMKSGETGEPEAGAIGETSELLAKQHQALRECEEWQFPARYHKLQDLLAAGEWKEADRETALVMLQVAGREEEGWLSIEALEKFPCEDLHAIDKLWVKYSDGRFGFSVQKRIWLEEGGKVDYGTECRLGDRVGWREGDRWLRIENLTYGLAAPTGHLPCVPVSGFWRNETWRADHRTGFKSWRDGVFWNGGWELYVSCGLIFIGRAQICKL